MGSGIYHEIVPGFVEEVNQSDIKFWCDQCQFPLDYVKCQTRESIQRCWNEIGSKAGAWHLIHECPFTHVNQPCRCNDFKTLQEAFASVDLVYQEPDKSLEEDG